MDLSDKWVMRVDRKSQQEKFDAVLVDITDIEGTTVIQANVPRAEAMKIVFEHNTGKTWTGPDAVRQS